MRVSARASRGLWVSCLLGCLGIVTAAAPASADGELDATFGTNGVVVATQGASPASVVVQPDGALAVAGSFSVRPQYGFVARFTDTGAPDGAFGAGGFVQVTLGDDGGSFSGLALQPDGKLVAAGTAKHVTTADEGVLARFASDGTLDTGFGTGGIVRAPLGDEGGAFVDVAPMPDGTLVAAGHVIQTLNFGLLARYLADGTLDTSFGTDGMTTLGLDEHVLFTRVLRQPDGMLLATGSTSVGGVNGCIVARYDADGTIDPTFGTDGVAHVPLSPGAAFCEAVALQSDGKIIVAGALFNVFTASVAVIRLLPGGTPDASFGTNGVVLTTQDGALTGGTDMLVQPDDKIVVVGVVQVNQLRFPDTLVLRYLPDGNLDPDFDGDGVVVTTIDSGPSTAGAVARQPDAKLVVASNVGGIALARYFGDGTAPSTTTTSSSTTTTLTTGVFPTTHRSTTMTTSTSTSSSTTTLPGCSCANPCEACDPELGCRVPDAAACGQASPRRASLSLKDGADDSRDQLAWKWKSASAVSQGDFGDPTTTEAYVVCVIDRPGGVATAELVASVPAGGACGGKPCWKATRTGFSYSDPSAASGGIRKIQLKAGEAGRGKATVKGKGAHLDMADLPLTTPVTVRLVRIGSGACWESSFSAPARNDTVAFTAKSD